MSNQWDNNCLKKILRILIISLNLLPTNSVIRKLLTLEECTYLFDLERNWSISKKSIDIISRIESKENWSKSLTKSWNNLCNGRITNTKSGQICWKKMPKFLIQILWIWKNKWGLGIAKKRRSWSNQKCSSLRRLKIYFENKMIKCLWIWRKEEGWSSSSWKCIKDFDDPFFILYYQVYFLNTIKDI